jgi:hypothetical protein
VVRVRARPIEQVLLIALVIMVAWKADAVHPRGALRADVLGCLRVDSAPTVAGASVNGHTTLSLIRLRKEREPHSSWARRVELSLGRTLAPRLRLSWVADSMTDTVRVIASDGFVGVTLRLRFESRRRSRAFLLWPLNTFVPLESSW